MNQLELKVIYIIIKGATITLKPITHSPEGH